MKTFVRLLLVLLCLAPGAFAQSAWKEYVNPRFGFKFSYPPTLKALGPAPGNGMGRTFASKGEEFVVTGSGHFLHDETLDSRWQQALADYGSHIGYKRKAKDWFVVSGAKGGREFYVKLHVSGGNWAELSIHYPHAKAKQYDPWVEKIVKSFVPFLKGPGYDRAP